MAARRLLTPIVLAILIGATGCGRKGPLDTPYDSAVQARKDAEKAKEPLPPEPAKPVKDKPFFLDRLIQ